MARVTLLDRMKRLGIVLSVLALAFDGVACGGGAAPATASVHVPAPDAAAPVLPRAVGDRTSVRLRFEGAKKVPEADLARAVCIDKPAVRCPSMQGRSHEEVIDYDELLLLAVYYDRGFVRAKVDHRVEAAPGGIEVVYMVEEHDLYVVREVVLREDDPQGKPVEMIGGTRAWNERFAKHAGGPFRRSAIADDMAKLRRAYRDAGYPFVEADPQSHVDLDARTIALTVPVRRGDACVFERVKVEGPTRSDVRALVAPLEGRPFSETKLDELKAALQVQGYTADVSIKLSGPGRIEVSVEIE